MTLFDRKRGRRLDDLVISKVSGVDLGASGLEGWAILKALNSDPSDLLKSAAALGIGIDALADSLADASVVVDADPAVLATLHKFFGDIVEAEESALTKAGKKMAGGRLDKLKALHAGMGDLIAEVDDEPDADDQNDNETKETKKSVSTTTTTEPIDPDSVRAAITALAKSRSATSGKPAHQEYFNIVKETPGLYEAFQQVSSAPTPVQASATTAPEYTPFEAFAKAAKAPRPGDSRSPFQTYNDYLNSPEGRAAYAEYDRIHG